MIEALGKLPSLDAVSGLVALQPASGEEVHRVLALARLGAVRGVASLEGQNHLLSRLDDGDPGIRAAAAYYFGRVPDPTNVPSRYELFDTMITEARFPCMPPGPV